MSTQKEHIVQGKPPKTYLSIFVSSNRRKALLSSAFLMPGQCQGKAFWELYKTPRPREKPKAQRKTINICTLKRWKPSSPPARLHSVWPPRFPCPLRPQSPPLSLAMASESTEAPQLPRCSVDPVRQDHQTKVELNVWRHAVRPCESGHHPCLTRLPHCSAVLAFTQPSRGISAAHWDGAAPRNSEILAQARPGVNVTSQVSPTTKGQAQEGKSLLTPSSLHDTLPSTASSAHQLGLLHWGPGSPCSLLYGTQALTSFWTPLQLQGCQEKGWAHLPSHLTKYPTPSSALPLVNIWLGGDQGNRQIQLRINKIK